MMPTKMNINQRRINPENFHPRKTVNLSRPPDQSIFENHMLWILKRNFPKSHLINSIIQEHEC